MSAYTRSPGEDTKTDQKRNLSADNSSKGEESCDLVLERLIRRVYAKLSAGADLSSFSLVTLWVLGNRCDIAGLVT